MVRLSIYAKVEKTIIDGKVFYDIDKDAELRKSILQERERLINKMKADKKAGIPVQKAGKKDHHNFHCDDVVDMQLNQGR